MSSVSSRASAASRGTPFERAAHMRRGFLAALGMTRPSSALRAPSPRERGEGELVALSPLAPRERGEGGLVGLLPLAPRGGGEGGLVGLLPRGSRERGGGG